MGSLDRSKKRGHLWKKATIHFLLCFMMGFFTGFAPTSKTSIFPSNVTMSPQPIEAFHQEKMQGFNVSLKVEAEPAEEEHNNKVVPPQDKEETEELEIRKLVIVITPTTTRNRLRGPLLRRLASMLKLVAQPLLWIVVEQQSLDSEVSEILRRSGIMCRHVVFKENFTDTSSEMDFQRNAALNHIEHHRLTGIVHFAGLSNVYDLAFFEELRAVEGFGTWPIAKLGANKQKVVIEGPVCDSSEVLGWHLRNMTDATPLPLHISSFAFNSSILWDPERWGRTSSVQDSSQNSIRFVRKEVLEEEAKLKGIPTEGCSKVLLWDLKM
ncbi:hypothetical protein SASPL_105657 [Salvia splendens]|uniref:Glycosyltransferases n=1 Tax=Salvia splendens TaxID=180675 RepID=A0A8X9AAY3_SALSN|nr:beta-1,4-xylosyltransferase IRX9-like [Salvia splendens]XP_042046045.1 beta-1,4-xylosyltransferase IRX9-like [Salvia splendens]KAG6434036.1 hypothetical protein SASPL_105657 [Salvia splendens]